MNSMKVVLDMIADEAATPREKRYEEPVSRAGAAAELADRLKPKPFAAWHEDDQDVLWWKLPVMEPPYCGTPLDSSWPWGEEDQKEDQAALVFTRLVVPTQPEHDALVAALEGPPLDEQPTSDDRRLARTIAEAWSRAVGWPHISAKLTLDIQKAFAGIRAEGVATAIEAAADVIQRRVSVAHIRSCIVEEIRALAPAELVAVSADGLRCALGLCDHRPTVSGLHCDEVWDREHDDNCIEIRAAVARKEG